MELADFIEKWGRTIFESPFGSAKDLREPPEVAEVRFAILDAIKKKSYRAGGKKVFPYNYVRINLRGVEERSALFEGDFFKKYFEQEIRTSLAKADCRYPEDLQVDVNVTRELPKPGEEWLWIDAEIRERPPAPPVRRSAKLVVLLGKANEGEIVLQKARTNLGRTADVYRARGLSRRNDLAFTEDNEINRTVSREHAHILYDQASGEYRLYNDRWYKRGDQADGSCGLWIVRDGMSQEVHRNARGTKLQPGDEIHLGNAILKIQIE